VGRLIGSRRKGLVVRGGNEHAGGQKKTQSGFNWSKKTLLPCGKDLVKAGGRGKGEPSFDCMYKGKGEICSFVAMSSRESLGEKGTLPGRKKQGESHLLYTEEVKLGSNKWFCVLGRQKNIFFSKGNGAVRETKGG